MHYRAEMLNLFIQPSVCRIVAYSGVCDSAGESAAKLYIEISVAAAEISM